MTIKSVHQEDYFVTVLRDKYGRYYDKMAQPNASLRRAWRFYNTEELAIVMSSAYYKPDPELEWTRVLVKITMITVEQTMEDEIDV